MTYKLFCFIVGCTLEERNIEQHDVVFVIAEDVSKTVSQLRNFWPEAGDKLHIDCWREISCIDDYKIEVTLKNDSSVKDTQSLSLFFINLGGYKKNEFDEFHYKCFIVAKNSSEAINLSKQSTFFKHTGFNGARSHVDDKYGIDVDNIYNIEEILSPDDKKNYKINITKNSCDRDILHIGYLTLAKLEKSIFDTE